MSAEQEDIIVDRITDVDESEDQLLAEEKSIRLPQRLPKSMEDFLPKGVTTAVQSKWTPPSCILMRLAFHHF